MFTTSATKMAVTFDVRQSPRWADCISLDDEYILRYHVEQTDTEMYVATLGGLH